MTARVDSEGNAGTTDGPPALAPEAVAGRPIARQLLDLRLALLSAALFVLLIILPFVDRNPARHWRQRPVAITLALLILLVVAALTVLTAFGTAKTHLGM